MRNISDIIQELMSHPECIDATVYTVGDFAEGYANDFVNNDWPEDLGLGDCDIDFYQFRWLVDLIENSFTDDDKRTMRYNTQDYYDIINDVVDKSPYGNFDELECYGKIKNILKREQKINKILKGD